VWETVTSLNNYAWRSDLSKIEILNEKQFVGYTKEGYATTLQLLLLNLVNGGGDMENDNIKGHWIGVFTQKGGQTEIDFTEDVVLTHSSTFTVPITFVSYVYTGFLYDSRTIGCAAI